MVQRQEGVRQRRQLVRQYTQGPHIRLLVVRRVLAELWTEVVWGAHHGGGELSGGAQQPGDTQVTNLDASVAKEEVGGLEIAMENLERVQVGHALGGLP